MWDRKTLGVNDLGPTKVYYLCATIKYLVKSTATKIMGLYQLPFKKINMNVCVPKAVKSRKPISRKSQGTADHLDKWRTLKLNILGH